MLKNNLSYKILEKTFKDENSKEAYKQVLKWLAVNVVGKEEISKNTSYQIIKDQKAKIPTFKLILYVNADESECSSNFCMKCKNMYASFFQIEKMHCEECKLNAYHKHNKKYMESIVTVYQKIMEDSGNEKNN